MPHSFAGEVAFGLAEAHPSWVYGAVFVDANLPDFYDMEQTLRQRDETKSIGTRLVQRTNDKRTRSIKNMLDNQVETNTIFRGEVWPAGRPVIVILSAKTPFDDAVEAGLWRQANEGFARAAPNRSLIVATGSSHDIVSDKPALIIDAITRLVNTFHQVDH